MKLVDNWRTAHRWASQWCNAAGTGLAAAWLVVPDDMRALVPTPVVVTIALVIFITGFVSRMIKQRGPNDVGTTDSE